MPIEITPDNVYEVIEARSLVQATAIMNSLPKEAFSNIAFCTLCCYLQLNMLMAVPFLTTTDKTKSNFEFLGKLIQTSGVKIQTLTAFSEKPL